MAKTLRPGQLVPGTKYRVVREIGRGGFGVVYSVEHTFLEARAVLKVLHAELAPREDVARRMRSEARTLAGLRHPNIVEVWDGGMTDEMPPRPFFVMERLVGASLGGIVKRLDGGVGITSALRLAVGVLEGLEHAHRVGVVHRDVKPDNVFLHRTSADLTVAKVLDFGTAHLLAARGSTSAGHRFVGTPRYSAPEQLRGEAPTAQTDIYGVGLVLHQLLTGVAPFAHRKGVVEVLDAHCNEELPPVSSVVRGAPLALDRFIATMLAKEPSARPPTAFAAAVALREILALVERRQAGSIHAPEFRTEATPMDNILVEERPSATVGPAAEERTRTRSGGTPLVATRTSVIESVSIASVPPPSPVGRPRSDAARARRAARAEARAEAVTKARSSRVVALAVALALLVALFAPIAWERLR